MEIATLILPWCRDGNYGWKKTLARLLRRGNELYPKVSA